MYFMPDGVTEAIIEPHYVVDFAPVAVVGGREIVGRKNRLAYSLRSLQADLVDLFPVDPSGGQPGDPKVPPR